MVKVGVSHGQNVNRQRSFVSLTVSSVFLENSTRMKHVPGYMNWASSVLRHFSAARR